MLRLTLLGPDIIEAILAGTPQEGMPLPGLMEGGREGLARRNRHFLAALWAVEWLIEKNCCFSPLDTALQRAA